MIKKRLQQLTGNTSAQSNTETFQKVFCHKSHGRIIPTVPRYVTNHGHLIHAQIPRVSCMLLPCSVGMHWDTWANQTQDGTVACQRKQDYPEIILPKMPRNISKAIMAHVSMAHVWKCVANFRPPVTSISPPFSRPSPARKREAAVEFVIERAAKSKPASLFWRREVELFSFWYLCSFWSKWLFCGSKTSCCLSPRWLQGKGQLISTKLHGQNFVHGWHNLGCQIDRFHRLGRLRSKLSYLAPI